ncbi:MAG: hypothetical protein Q9193_003375 [Seirophora villosa]
MVGGRQGDNWQLTVDTTQDIAGRLNAEYILDGTQIKLDTGKAAEAAAAVADDLAKWNPFKDMQHPKVYVEDSTCNPWTITKPNKAGAFRDLAWSTQVTAPLPLEAIHELFEKAAANEASPLLPGINPAKGMVYVTKDFFQANPHGISPDSVERDVLGFFSLVLSYAKGALTVTNGNSPKKIISIMPRTDWTTIFDQIKPAVSGSLYDLVKILACYRSVDGVVEIDQVYCEGNLNDPKPNSQMDEQVFSLSSGGQSDKCSVKEWMQSIQDNHSPDRLSQADKVIDGSIGGLGKALENVLHTDRAPNDLSNRKTKADLSNRKTKADLSIRKTKADLSNRKTKADLSIRKTKADLSIRKTKADLSIRKTKADLSNWKTKADLSNRKTKADTTPKTKADLTTPKTRVHQSTTFPVVEDDHERGYSKM